MEADELARQLDLARAQLRDAQEDLHRARTKVDLKTDRDRLEAGNVRRITLAVLLVLLSLIAWGIVGCREDGQRTDRARLACIEAGHVWHYGDCLKV